MKHPEQNDNEIFLTNVFDDKDYYQIGWKTKRKGVQAYKTDEAPIVGYGYPVFVGRAEITEALNKTEFADRKRVYQDLLNS